jgi:hypothetical protein
VAPSRLARVLAQLSSDTDASWGTRRLCEVSADITEMSGAGIMLLSGDVPQGSLCTSNTVSQLIEDLQYTLGEGPCIDAHIHGNVVTEPDLAQPARSRWHAFCPPAIDAGALAVFGFPVRVGAARLGALNLYRDRPGPLTDDQHADALVMADVAARTILDMQAQAPPGALAADLELEANFQFVVHQAAGMTSVQLGVSVGDALIRLRAHAFATDRLLADVAEDVVNRHLRFDRSGPEE